MSDEYGKNEKLRHLDALIHGPLRRMYLFVTKGYRYTSESSKDDYNAKQYWTERHTQNSLHSLQGVGHSGLTPEENHAQYKSAELIFKGLFHELAISPDSLTLELGFGNGFYTGVCHALGISNYNGVDITSVNIPGLKKKHPTYTFAELDVATEGIKNGQHDFIFMIDVSQHITSDEKLAFCLEKNVKNLLKPGGIFITTDSLKNRKVSFYEVNRTLDFYQRILQIELKVQPIQFRDKYIFAFKR